MVYVHNLNPFAIQFTENFGVRWYGLAYLAGFVSSYLILQFLIQRGRVLLPLAKLADYITYAAIGCLAGGRVGYCLFYSPELITDFGGEFPFWGVLRVHKGGMASHGGILGIMIASYIFSRQHNIDYFHLLDLNVFGGSLGIFFGRIANFVNGELYGREAPVGLSWAVKFPQEMYLWGVGQIEQIAKLAKAAEELSSINLQGTSEVLNSSVWSKWVQSYRYDGHARYAVEATIEKIILAIQNGNLAVQNAVAPLLTPRYPSQIIQALFEGLFVFVILVIIWIRPRKAGVVASWFGFCYAVARIFGEQFRMPDAQLGFQALGLTRGQWLSIGMLFVAIGFVIWAQLRKGPRLGGFFPEKVKSNA